MVTTFDIASLSHQSSSTQTVPSAKTRHRCAIVKTAALSSLLLSAKGDFEELGSNEMDTDSIKLRWKTDFRRLTQFNLRASASGNCGSRFGTPEYISRDGGLGFSSTFSCLQRIVFSTEHLTIALKESESFAITAEKKFFETVSFFHHVE